MTQPVVHLSEQPGIDLLTVQVDDSSDGTHLDALYG
jgi:hypothetical protein